MDIPVDVSVEDRTAFLERQYEPAVLPDARPRRAVIVLHTLLTLCVLPCAVCQTLLVSLPLQLLTRVVLPDLVGVLTGGLYGVCLATFVLLPIAEAQGLSWGGSLCAGYSALLSFIAGHIAVFSLDLVVQRVPWRPQRWLQDLVELAPDRCFTLHHPSDAQWLGVMLGLSQAYPLLQRVDLEPANGRNPPEFSQWCRPFFFMVHPLILYTTFFLVGCIMRASSIPTLKLHTYAPRSLAIYHTVPTHESES